MVHTVAQKAKCDKIVTGNEIEASEECREGGGSNDGDVPSAGEGSAESKIDGLEDILETVAITCCGRARVPSVPCRARHTSIQFAIFVPAEAFPCEGGMKWGWIFLCLRVGGHGRFDLSLLLDRRQKIGMAALAFFGAICLNLRP